MNSKIPLLALCVVLASPGFAVGKKSRRKDGGTLPPISPMLMVSVSPGNTVESMESSGLITTKLGGRDLDFFESLMGTGQLQVLLGELLKAKAESPRVRFVGVTLASAQAQENKQINRLATLNGLALSAGAAGAQRQTSAELEKLSGTSFDIACVSKIVEANRQTVHAYEEGAESKNPEIQSFSQQMLPIARERLRIAEKMIEAPEKPAADLATPAPRTSPLQLRPPTPSPAKQPAATPASAQAAATPPPLTLGGTPPAVPLLAPLPAVATPAPLSTGGELRKIEDRLATPTPSPLNGGPSSIPPPANDGQASPYSAAPGTPKP